MLLIAQQGWRLLPDYRFNPATGLWRHHQGPAEPPLQLNQISYDETGTMRYPRHHDRAPETELERYLQDAATLLASHEAIPQPADGPAHSVSADFEHLRWFDLPADCLTSG